MRRLLLVVLVVVGTATASRLLASILSTEGLTLGEIGILLLFTLTFAWIGVSFWTAFAGFIRILLPRRAPATTTGLLAPGPSEPITSRNALAIPVYHEDVGEVGARIAAVWHSLERAGELDAFEIYVLSDSRDPGIAEAEDSMWRRLCEELGAGGRLFYRRRAENKGRKSGNIEEFLTRFGRRFEHFVVLDADSVMSGPTLVRLVRLMEANPRAGLIQTVPKPVLGETLFARIQQFAAHLYGPLFAAGTAFWYPAKSNYWGHNAIIRTEAFASSCGLPKLPGEAPLGGEILSHDFVEAALLQRAGWEVWLEPDLGGSYEALPPTLDDYAVRDRRWCQGNLQHARLLFVKGLIPVSRGHLVLGVVSYLASPLWFLLLALTTGEAVRADLTPWVYFPDADRLFPVWPVSRWVELLGLFSVTMAMLLLPKFLSAGLAFVDRTQATAYGGRGGLTKSLLVEILFAALLAPILMVQQTVAVLATLFGGTVGWSPQRRGGGGGGLFTAIRRYALITLLGVGWGLFAQHFAPGLLIWLTPVLAGLVLSAPLAYLTGMSKLGLAARRRGWFLIPEEVAPPPELRPLDRHAGRGSASSHDDLTPLAAVS